MSVPTPPPTAALAAGSTELLIEARASWAAVVRAGETLSIIDLGGNQAVDFLAFDAHDATERYSAPDTIAAQGNIFLVAGTELLSNEGRTLMTVTATTC